MSKGGSVILRIYFALVAFVTLMILVFSTGDLLNIALKTYVFPMADLPGYASICDTKPYPDSPAVDCEKVAANERLNASVQKQQSAVRDISLLLIAAPLFWLHFRIVYRDWQELKKDKS